MPIQRDVNFGTEAPRILREEIPLVCPVDLRTLVLDSQSRQLLVSRFTEAYLPYDSCSFGATSLLRENLYAWV